MHFHSTNLFIKTPAIMLLSDIYYIDNHTTNILKVCQIKVYESGMLKCFKSDCLFCI